MTPQPQAKRGSHISLSTPAKSQYLIIYNAISFVLWTTLLGRVSYIVYIAGIDQIYPQSGSFIRNVQSLAILEVVHSLLGVVRAPIATTAIQVASRFLLVWGIVDLFGDSMLLGSRVRSAVGLDQEPARRNNQLAYLSMLVAWSVTECARYGYFVLFLMNGGDTKSVPKALSWLRYNTFFVLYPIGITSEFWLIYMALPFAKVWDQRYEYFLLAVLVSYIPGSYVMYTHMMAQRRRTMRGKAKAR